MDNIRYSQSKSVLESLSRIIKIDEKVIQEKLNKYKKLSDKEVINDLSILVYKELKDNNELLDYFLSLIQNINLSIVPSIESMKKELDNLFLNKNDNMTLDDNHKLVLDTLKYIGNLFNNEGIDYFITGSIACYLGNNIPLYRSHDNINIMINEDDLPRVKELMENSGYSYSDNRFPNEEEFNKIKNSKGHFSVSAKNPYNDFHIVFLIFRRKKDNSMTITEYIPKEYEGNIIIDRIDKSYTLEGTNIRFNNSIDLDGIRIKTCSTEYIYDLKSHYNRPKDITDMEKLEGLIDKSKLKELRRNTNTKQIVKNIELEKEKTM